AYRTANHKGPTITGATVGTLTVWHGWSSELEKMFLVSSIMVVESREGILNKNRAITNENCILHQGKICITMRRYIGLKAHQHSGCWECTFPLLALAQKHFKY
ncbi:MAG: hypothetical protein ACK53Y_12320, partial [bacterium]